jgi:hypothetical protein
LNWQSVNPHVSPFGGGVRSASSAKSILKEGSTEGKKRGEGKEGNKPLKEGRKEGRKEGNQPWKEGRKTGLVPGE